MPVFRYQAVDKRGRNLSGMMPAVDEASLDQKLRTFGLWLTDVETERASAPSDPLPTQGSLWDRFRSKKQRRELIDFCTLMTFQIKVGVPLVKALESSCRDCKDERFQRVLTDLQAQIESGLHFHEALARHPRIFTPHFVSVVRAGETSSKLPEAFQDLRSHLEWVDRTIAEVRQATLYPSIVVGVITVFVLFLFTYIIPKFVALLDSVHVQQPFLTQVVFTASAIVKGYWWIWLPSLVLLAIGVPLARRWSPRFALAWDRSKLHLPIFGELNLMLALSRFMHNLAILYRSGLPILSALELCKRGLVGNLVVEKAVGEVEQDVKTGSTISEALHRQPIFPAIVLRMVSMGEVTGSLDQSLDNVAEYYNDIIPRRIKSVLGVLEPLLMLTLIFVVGAVALAIYLPIISLMGSLKQ